MKINYMQLLALPLASLSLASTKPLAPDLIFEEKNGTIAIEAEHFVSQEKSDVRAWHIVSTENAPAINPDGDPSHAATASGGAYLESLPDTRRSHGDKLIKGTNFTDQGGQIAVLTYPILFNTPGRYYCWVRTFSTNTEDNGIHLGLNRTWPASGAKMQWTKKNQWAWDSKQRTQKVHPGIFGQIWIDIPEPGLHKVHFSMREDGFEFDKFILTTAKPDQAKPPRAYGPATQVKIGTPPAPFKATKPKKESRFPEHWGDQPKIQTRDLVPLPGKYGRGSSTLRNWILENQKTSTGKPSNGTAPPSKPATPGQSPSTNPATPNTACHPTPTTPEWPKTTKAPPLTKPASGSSGAISSAAAGVSNITSATSSPKTTSSAKTGAPATNPGTTPKSPSTSSATKKSPSPT
ncbi:MAG: hypothetical protein ACJAQT_002426 [Akkermansiaceae bacterium]|jgi:hypothetical protein